MSAVLEPGTTARAMDVFELRRARRTVSPYATDLGGWVQERLHERLWSKQREIARSVVDHRRTVVPSCHSAGKSFIGSRLAAAWLDVHPVGDAFVVTTAPSQPQVRSILWREMVRAHRKGRLAGSITRGQIPEWTIDGELVAFGRKTADSTDPEEAMANFQGIHARYLLVIIDEAAGVPRWLLDAVLTLATGENDRILAIGNPTDPTSWFAEACSPGSGWNEIRIPASATPRFTGEPVDPHIPLITPTWVEDRRRDWGEDSPLYQARVNAQFPDVDDSVVFPPALIRKMQETTLPGLVRGGYGADIARYGDSETAVYRNRGGHLRLVKATRKRSTVETAAFLADLGRTPDGAQLPVPLVVDGDGLGAGVVDMLRAAERHVIEFRGAVPARNEADFANRRAEIFWVLRRDAELGLVDIDPDDDVLAAQLGKIRWKTDSKGRPLLESKDEMLKRGVKSPDRADAAAYAYSAPDVVYESEKPKPAETLTGDILAGAEGLPPGATSLTADLMDGPL